MAVQGEWLSAQEYLPFLCGLVLIAGVSFVDDIRSLPDSVRLVVQTQDVTYLIVLLVYGFDGCLTICHRIMLHENLGQAHRKHAYQLRANELKIGHVTVSLVYMALQLAVF